MLYQFSQNQESPRVVPVEMGLRILDTLPGIGEKTSSVRADILKKIETRIEKNLPLEIVLPAFPAKSPNRQKTLGAMPDLGEVMALQGIEELCKKIERFYRPGAKVVICTDGRVFSDLVGVSDTAVNAYSIGIRNILKEFSLTRLHSFDLDSVFDHHTFAEMRDALMQTYAPSVEEIRDRTKRDSGEQLLFNGIHRFIFEDRLAMDLGKSRSQTRQEAKHIAVLVIQRSNAWSSLVEKRFPEAVRLSIHPQSPQTAKLPIRLLPSENAWRTPWHAVLLTDGKSHRLVTHAEALQRGAQYDELHGRWGYFKEANI